MYELGTSDVALLVIDVQCEYFDADGPAFVPAAASVLPSINTLTAAFRATQRPVVVIEHVHRADGSDVGRMADFDPPGAEPVFVAGTERAALYDGLVTADSDIRVVKRRYDSFVATDLDAVLRTLGVRTVVICGYMASFCCESTARSAHDRDYQVVYVRDAVAGPDLEAPDGTAVSHEAVLAATTTALGCGFAEIAETRDVVTRLRR